MEAKIYQIAVTRFNSIEDTDTLFLGLAEECGEVMSERTRVNRKGKVARGNQSLSDELGDVLWYLTMIADRHDLSLGVIMEENLEKLNKRMELSNEKH